MYFDIKNYLKSNYYHTAENSLILPPNTLKKAQGKNCKSYFFLMLIASRGLTTITKVVAATWAAHARLQPPAVATMLS